MISLDDVFTVAGLAMLLGAVISTPLFVFRYYTSIFEAVVFD